MGIEMILKIVLGGMLAAASAEDIRRQRISLPILLACCVLAVVRVIAVRSGMWQEYLYAILPGGLLLLLAYVTKEKVGYGDGLLLLLAGIIEGAVLCIMQLFAALLLASGISAVILAAGRGTGKTRIPFIPFFFVMYILIR